MATEVIVLHWSYIELLQELARLLSAYVC